VVAAAREARDAAAQDLDVINGLLMIMRENPREWTGWDTSGTLRQGTINRTRIQAHLTVGTEF
jgi:hypothetical protein